MGFAELVAAADAAALSALGGESVIYDGAGAPVTVTGIFDELYALANDADAGVEAVGPAVFLRLADLPTSPEDETDALRLTIRGVLYRVVERRPAGMGGMVLALRRVT